MKRQAPQQAQELDVEGNNFKALVKSWRLVSQLQLGQSGKSRNDKGNVFSCLPKVSLETVFKEYYAVNDDGTQKTLPFAQFITSLVQAVSRASQPNARADVTLVKFSEADWTRHLEHCGDVEGLEIVFFPATLSYYNLEDSGFSEMFRERRRPCNHRPRILCGAGQVSCVAEQAQRC